MGIISWLGDLEVRKALWLLPIVWAIHSVDEWFLFDHYERQWADVGDLDAADVRTWLVLMGALGIVWTLVATRFRKDWLAVGLVLLFFVPQGVGNFAQHIYWMIAFAGDSPGIATSSLLVVPACVWVSYRAHRAEATRWWFLLLLYLLTIPILIVTIQLGDTFPEGGLPFYRISGALNELLGI